MAKKIELLAPARNLATGITAINSGADAVYIGASNYGARQAAGNSVEEIGELVNYAHIFGAKVYVTLNTIIEEDDIANVEELITRLYKIGVDALIVQDFGIREMNIPPISLHCSTQMDNRTVEKAKFLADTGFPRVVLARELSLKEIAAIHAAIPDTELEVFVHGALCVSYSGQCYASQHCFGRSANKGACAQFCRLAFNLEDADGNVICRDKHLLSLKDMNRSEYLEEMLDAGVTSFKIEGRLKDESYVKNITAYYRQKLDAIFERRSDYCRASYGQCTTEFTPQPDKSFNRGFTDYMLVGNKKEIASFDTPKSIGERMGSVRIVARNFFTVTGEKAFANGDGACFIGKDGKLHGFRINSVEGNRILPHKMPQLQPGDIIYRNYDCDFERELSRPDVARRLSIDIIFGEDSNGFTLGATDELGTTATIRSEFTRERAKRSQKENIINQLSKLGNTPFEAGNITIELSDDWFVPSSLLSEMRRQLCDELILQQKRNYSRETMNECLDSARFPLKELDYRGNVSNSLARKFYKKFGVEKISPSFEQAPVKGTLMFCKHCIKQSLGWCTKEGGRPPYREPFYLVNGDGSRFRLSFDCKECIMHVITE